MTLRVLQFTVNHLWQSTLFALLVGMATPMLRTNRAQVRYAMWLAASAKFLVPFSLLIGIGSRLGWRDASPIPPLSLPSVVEQAGAPFSAMAAKTGVSALQGISWSDWIPFALCALWVIGTAAILFSWWRRWVRLSEALCTASAIDLKIGVPIAVSAAFPEPGVFGVRRPVLLLRDGITDRLSSSQLKAVLAHELCHIRRRDNLTAALHMSVEALFWFHPLIWWLGARLTEERERACDEEVLLEGHEPEDYAEGILGICEISLEANLPCVAGVTGANLRERIERIISSQVGIGLSLTRKMALAMSGAAAFAVPVIVGVLSAPPVGAQSFVVPPAGKARPTFEVASVKPIDRATMHRDHEGARLDRERFVDRTDLLQFIVHAYIKGSSCTVKAALGEACPLIVGAIPEWVRTDRFEIQGTLAPDSLPAYTSRQLRNNEVPELDLMLQALLEDRFNLKVHRETRQIPVYALTVGKNGPKLKKAAQSELRKGPDGTPLDVHGLEGFRRLPGQDGTVRNSLHFQGSSMSETAASLGTFFDRPVVDRTGLTGEYDFNLEYDVEQNAPTPATADRSSGLGGNFINPYTGLTADALSAALADLGLRLESVKAPVEVLVVDHVEKPKEN